MADMPRVIELIRVSTDAQHDRGTPEVQRHALDELRARRPGRILARIDPAHGVSGALPIDQRPDVRELRRLVAEHGMEELRVYDIDRLSRAERIEDRLAILGIAADAGAIIVDATGREIDPADDMGELTYYLRTLFARQERRKILSRTMDGKRARAAQGGLIAGGPGYGYHYDSATRTLSVVESEAPVVRLVFRLAVEGVSLPRIAERLQGDGVPTRHGGPWSYSTVRCVIHASAHRGVYTQRVQGHAYDMAVPRIVEDATWYAAQDAVASRHCGGRRPTGTVQALCRGRLRCGTCGAPMIVRAPRSPAYHCRSLRRETPEPSCGSGYHRVADVDEAVWRVVREVIEQPELLAEASAGREDMLRGWRDQLAQCDRAITRVERDEHHVLDMLRDDLISADVARERLARTRTTRETAARSRETAQRALAQHEHDTAALGASVAQWRGVLDGADFAARRALVEAVIPAGPGYGIRVRAGELEVAGALPLAVAGSSDPGVCMDAAPSRPASGTPGTRSGTDSRGTPAPTCHSAPGSRPT